MAIERWGRLMTIFVDGRVSAELPVCGLCCLAVYAAWVAGLTLEENGSELLPLRAGLATADLRSAKDHCATRRVLCPRVLVEACPSRCVQLC